LTATRASHAVTWQKDKACAIKALLRKRKPESLSFSSQKFVGDLKQKAGTIARERVTPARATMYKVQQDFDALADYVMRGLALEAGNKAYAAGIVFKSWIVQS
jgi:hypothetical protein